MKKNFVLGNYRLEMSLYKFYSDKKIHMHLYAYEKDRKNPLDGKSLRGHYLGVVKYEGSTKQVFQKAMTTLNKLGNPSLDLTEDIIKSLKEAN